MSKGQGLSVSALIAAGLLLRPVASLAPQQGGSSKGDASPPASTAATDVQAEGPWIASCNYWAPAREEQSPKAVPQVHNTLDVKGGGIDLHVNLEESNKQQELGCISEPKTRWGFPEGGPKITLKAIIATVPDPVHTHLALAFDRTVDAILQAAVDDHYVSSYHWLPWKNRADTLKTDDFPGDAEPGHDPERERQPGLIVLKHVPQGDSSDSYDSSHSFYDVIYLFLVAESPSQGVDGFQLQRAFSYEAEMESALAGHGTFSRGNNGHVSIIGPYYSGSAASLRAGIETAHSKDPRLLDFDVTGITATDLSVKQLTGQKAMTPNVVYLSFSDNRSYDTKTLRELLLASGYDLGRVALLIEDDTTLGNATKDSATKLIVDKKRYDMPVISFPREISLLRNAQVTDDRLGSEATPYGSAPRPYLRFSLKDFSSQDSVPEFSRGNTPLSQEAQLMAIARQLHRFRSQFIAIASSNMLDQIFLSQFLHRACPDARLVFFGSDLLLVREVDNVPFIGSITITPYTLIGLVRVSGLPYRAVPASASVGFYNAVTYTLWDKKQPLRLQGYRSPLQSPTALHPPLWATAIGSDGYYPLAIVSPCASDRAQILPPIGSDGEVQRTPCDVSPAVQLQPSGSYIIYPSRPWFVLCTLVTLLCLFHLVSVIAADYWSPFTRDLAIRDNDQPRRRSMYVHVAAAMLFSMAFVISLPEMVLAYRTQSSFLGELTGVVCLGAGLLALVATVWKARGHIGWSEAPFTPSQDSAPFRRALDHVRASVYLFFSLLALMAPIALAVLWAYLCLTESAGHPDGMYLVGLSFSYRCVNPGSGVSPVVPVLLLFFGWYLWGLLQTLRLRFSESGRPWLPGRIEDPVDGRLFVSDDDLSRCESRRDCCLYGNITCLLTTRALLRRLRRFRNTPKVQMAAVEPGAGSAEGGGGGRGDGVTIDIILVAVYVGLLVWFSFFTPVKSLDHFLWIRAEYRSSPYELLVGVLFFPLAVISLTGWLRMILIWKTLESGLLERLEVQPIRFAFSRLKPVGWMTLLRQGGSDEQRRDMARSVESMRQMLHQHDLQSNVSKDDWDKLDKVNTNLLEEIGQLRSSAVERPDRPQPGEHGYDFMRRIEHAFASFSQLLLSSALIPYWKNVRTGPVESEEVEELPIQARRSAAQVEREYLPMELRAGPASTEPPFILVAEEFLAIRYMSLIRAVLANMRYLMILVSASFALAIMAWNSYPFQPRQQVDWSFTGLLAFLGAGVIWVLAQMHRNPILSRITDTKANELGWDFYLRIISFGAVPVLAWLAYEFPDIGGVIGRFLQPGVPVIK